MALKHLGLFREGGSTASLDGQTQIQQYTTLVLSMFKYGGSTTYANSLRASYPGLQRLLGYQIAADLDTTADNGGVNQSAATAHDSALAPGSKDYWVLRSSYPSGAITSAYGTSAWMGNIASQTFRDQWVTNAISRAQTAGIDGIFIDNVLGYLNGVSPVDPATGTTYTDATWANAMVAFIANIVPRLQAAGLYVLTNTYDGSGTYSGDAAWWTRIGAYADGMLDEYWMQNSTSMTTPRYVGTAWNQNYLGWLSMVDTAQGLSPKRAFWGNANNASTDTVVREYSYASYLLKWDGTTPGGLIISTADGSDMGAWALQQVDPGNPATTMQEINADGTTAASGTTNLFRRYYDKGIVLVNADPTRSYTITSYGDGRTYKDYTGTAVATGFTLAPAGSKVLTSDTTYGGGGGGGTGAWTKIAGGAGTYTGAVTSMAATLSAPIQVGDLVVVAVTRGAASDDFTDTCSDSLGNVYTAIGHTYDATQGAGYKWFYTKATVAGTPTCTVTFPGSRSFCNVAAVAYRASSGTIQLDTSATNASGSTGSGTDGLTVGPITTATDGELILATYANTGGTNALSAGTGYTLDQAAQLFSSNLLIIESETQTTHGSISATGTATGVTSFVAGIAAFKIATAVPTNTTLPVVSGTTQVGSALTTTNGVWTNSPTSYTYQWQRNGVNITSATASSYTLTTADDTHTLTCVVTATNGAGSTSATSAATATVTYPVPTNSVLPAISGTVRVGHTLSATQGTWANSPTSYAYQWKQDGVSIAGATASTYTLVAADRGHTITVTVSATNDGGTGSATSNATITVTYDPPTNTVLPSITGTASIGNTLTANPGTWTNSPTFTYQWNGNGVAIPGATSSTYTPTPTDISKDLTVTVTGTNENGSASATSAATSVVETAYVILPNPWQGIPLSGDLIDHIQNFLADSTSLVELETADPSSPAVGNIYFNTSTGQLNVFDGLKWWRVTLTRDP